MTVAEFAADWQRRFPRRDPATRDLYARSVAPFVRRFGGRTLGSVTPAIAYDYAREHPAQARYLRSLYTDARRVGLVDDNPFANLRVASSVGRRWTELPTLKQIEALEAVAPARIAGMATFAAGAGLRLGEQLGIRVEDFDGDVLRLETQLDPRGVRKPLKGASPPRSVLVPEVALEAVRGLLSASRGRLWPISRPQYAASWKIAREAIGVEWPWHMLRHLAAALQVERGADTRDVAYWLGHADDTQVRRLYARRVDGSAAIARLRAVA